MIRKKRHLWPILLFAILATVFIGSLSVSAAEKTVLTTLEKVAIREYPSSLARKIKWVKKGKTVVRLGTEGEWSYVVFGDVEGYVESYKLSGGTDTTLGKKICRCNSKVRVRPDGSSVTVGYIYQGTVITVYGIENGWYKIKYEGNYRYTHSSNYSNYTGSDPVPEKDSAASRVMRCRAKEGGLIRSSMVLYQDKRNRVGAVPYHGIVQVLATLNNGEWYRVNYRGTVGYMYHTVLESV